jgi:hypothetical protein
MTRSISLTSNIYAFFIQWFVKEDFGIIVIPHPHFPSYK